MRKFAFNKLVRDKISESIRSAGGKPVVRKLTDTEYLKQLAAKLTEEAAELSALAQANQTEASALLEELADVQEILQALLQVIGKSSEELESVRAAKVDKNGAFALREYILHVEVPDDPDAYAYTNYYLQNPDKYPEIIDNDD